MYFPETDRGRKLIFRIAKRGKLCYTDGRIRNLKPKGIMHMGIRVGIDLGGTNIKIGLVDENYKIVRRSSVSTGSDLSFGTVMDRIQAGVQEILAGDVPDAIGIGVPSTVLDRRIAVHTPNLDWKNCDVAAEMGKRFPGVPTAVGNDADCAALGESLAGAGSEYDSMVLLTLGTGVGGSVLYNGKVLLGDHGCGVEIGHMKVQADGELCGCGRRGCLEAYASATAVKREIRRAVEGDEDTVMKDWVNREHRTIGARMIFDAAAQGDAVGKRLLETYIHYLAIGVSNCVLLYRPQAIVIGGGIADAGETLFEPLNEQVTGVTYGSELLGCPKAVPALLGNDAGIIGAAYI